MRADVRTAGDTLEAHLARCRVTITVGIHAMNLTTLFKGTAFFGYFFLVMAVGALTIYQYAAAGAFIGCGLGIILSGNDPKVWAALPQWRRLLTMACLFVGVAFLVALFVRGLS